MPRIARIVVAGYPHHIVQRGNNKQPIFFDDEDRTLYLKLMKRYSRRCNCKIKAYCLMDNHVHMVAVPENKEFMGKMMQKISLIFTQYINKKYKRTGRLWECRFFSCVVEKDLYLLAVTRYIERNPVRAGFTQNPMLYKWSSARYHLSTNPQDIWVDPVWKDYLDREAYIKYLNEQEGREELKRIRKTTYKGMPFGTERFVKEQLEHAGIAVSTRSPGRPKIIRDTSE